MMVEQGIQGDEDHWATWGAVEGSRRGLQDPDRLRILYVIGALRIGGAETQLVALASGLDRRCFAPVVCCLEEIGPLAADLRRAEVPVELVSFEGLAALRNPMASGRRFWELVALMRRHKPMLVHAVLPHANILGAVAARLAGVPAVAISLRGLDPELPVWGRIATHLADLVLVNAEAVRDHAASRQGVSREKIRVIRNGLDLAAFDRAAACPTPDLPAGPLVVAVANPNRFKVAGLLVLVEAAAQVLREVPTARFLLVGDGPLRSQVEAAIVSHGLVGRICCLGTRRDVPAILRAAQVAVLPSLGEGLPNAVLEAMAAGKPVVASRVGGVPELVVDEGTGLLVPPGRPEALAEAIVRILRDPTRATAMGACGRQRVQEHFEVRRMIGETEQAYRDLIARKARRCPGPQGA